MAPGNGIIYEFGDFRLIPAEGLLLRHGEPVSLTLKAFATLLLLVERHGHLVSKSELLETVWEDSFVEEGAVTRSIHAIRHALGEDPKSIKFIQTIPRRGYRFVAPVQVVAGHSGAFRLSDMHGVDDVPTEDVTAAARSVTNGLAREITTAGRTVERPDAAVAVADARRQLTPGRRLFPSWAVYAGIAAVLVGGLVLYLTLSGGSILGKGNRNRIAVLPLKPVDAANRDPIYEIGIADSLILKLGSSKDLVVRQLSAVRQYVELDEDAVAIGKQQNVDYVLTSNYQVAGGKIKVTAQLLDVTTGKAEEAFSLERPSAEPFAAQDAIAREIGNRIAARFGVTASDARPKRGTESEEAYRSYQLGKALRHRINADDGAVARDYFNRAVELDPNYAQAWAALGDAWMAGGPADDSEGRRLAHEALDKALALDPNLPEAYVSLCDLRLSYEWDIDGAESACKRALELDPNSADAHHRYEWVLVSDDRYDEAFAEIKIAMDLEPASFRIQREYANMFAAARRYPEAEAQYKRAIDLNPTEPWVYLRAIRVLEAQGKESEAFEYLLKGSEILNVEGSTIERFKAAWAASGWRGVVAERIKAEEDSPNPAFQEIAEWYASLGNKEKAFENLEKAYQKRTPILIFLADESQHFDILHDDPRWADLMKRIKEK